MSHILPVSPCTITKQKCFPFIWLCERTTKGEHSQKYLSTKLWPLNSPFKCLFILFICSFNFKYFKLLQLAAAICTASVLSHFKWENEIRGRKPQGSILEISQNNLNPINFIFSTVSNHRRFLHIFVHTVRSQMDNICKTFKLKWGTQCHQSVIIMLSQVLLSSHYRSYI